mgnify:CR=1 FL=1
MQTRHLLKTTDTEIEGTQGYPIADISMGHTIVKKNLGSIRWNSQPGRWERNRKAPLPGTDPDLSLRKGTSQRTKRNFVLQP